MHNRSTGKAAKSGKLTKKQNYSEGTIAKNALGFSTFFDRRISWKFRSPKNFWKLLLFNEFKNWQMPNRGKLLKGEKCEKRKAVKLLKVHNHSIGNAVKSEKCAKKQNHSERNIAKNALAKFLDRILKDLLRIREKCLWPSQHQSQESHKSRYEASRHNFL